MTLIFIAIAYIFTILVSASEVLIQSRETRRLSKPRLFPQIPYEESASISGLGSRPLPEFFRTFPRLAHYCPLALKDYNFMDVFEETYTAYLSEFTGNNVEKLDLLNWSKSPIVESITFDFHFDVIQHIINRGELLNTELGHELIEEYLEYAFLRFDANFTILQYTNLLKLAIKFLDHRLLAALLKYKPYDGLFIDELWHYLIQISVDKSLYLDSNSSSNRTRQWLKIYHLLSLHFGACESLSDFLVQPKEESSDYSGIFEMDDEVEERNDLKLFNNLINSQPLFAALINLDARLFHLYFQFKSDFFDSISFIYYMNTFLSLNEDIKYFKPELELQITQMADTIFSCLSMKLESIAEICYNFSYNAFIQFLLIHSQKARASIPSKRDQCLILSRFVNRSKFDCQSMKLIWIAAFKLSLSDLETYLLPLVQRNSEMIRVLIYLVKIVDSAPKSLDQDWTNWNFTIDSNFPDFDKSSLIPYIYEAGRLLLARHFKVLPIHVQVTNYFREEYCFRDLEWFMNFVISKYRPDLLNFRVKINVMFSDLH